MDTNIDWTIKVLQRIPFVRKFLTAAPDFYRLMEHYARTQVQRCEA